MVQSYLNFLIQSLSLDEAMNDIEQILILIFDHHSQIKNMPYYLNSMRKNFTKYKFI